MKQHPLLLFYQRPGREGGRERREEEGGRKGGRKREGEEVLHENEEGLTRQYARPSFLCEPAQPSPPTPQLHTVWQM